MLARPTAVKTLHQLLDTLAPSVYSFGYGSGVFAQRGSDNKPVRTKFL